MSLEGLRKVLPQSLKSIAARALYDTLCRSQIYKTATIDEALRYRPISTFWISQDSINRGMAPGKELYKEYRPGCVVGGEWDKKTEPFADSFYYQSLKRHFIDGVPWSETELYRSAIDRNSGNYYHGCETIDDVQERMEYLDSVYKSIKEDGYLSQRKLRQFEDEPSSTPPELSEIRINIDRHGEPVFDDGRHRLAMAKLLDVEEIPVIVIGRHKEWWKQGGRVSDVANY